MKSGHEIGGCMYLCQLRTGRRGPSAVDSTPRGRPSKYRSALTQRWPVRLSGRSDLTVGGGFLSGYPNPPTTCLNFSLWRHVFV